MTSPGPRADATARATGLEPVRLARADRHESLLDAALHLVSSGDVDAVSIESVAGRAGVSRPLVYRHFANRADILAALYDRESERVHEELSAAVTAASSLLDMYRALFRGALAADRTRGPVFEALRAAAGRSAQVRSVQHRRDRQTVAFYARRAVREYGIPRREAEALTSMLLSALSPALARWHRNPTRAEAKRLEEVFLAMVSASLERLSPALVPAGPRAPR
ncbi:MAG TPA: helix-turn-helix domain-containing protein [Mycobacteriales bacterium]